MAIQKLHTKQMSLRIRRILDSMNKPRRDALKKLLPKGVFNDKSIKEFGSVKYPTGLLGVMPDGEGYGLLGHIAEEMLGLDAEQINIDSLLDKARKWHPDMTGVQEAKVRKSVTTAPFIERLVATRRLLESSFQGDVTVEPEVTVDAVQGHPDMVTATQVYEIKLTGMLKDNWIYFVFQAFSYAALLPATNQVNIVLPLQQHIWTCDVSAWTGRAAYLAALQEASTYYQTTAAANKAEADEICACCCIGSHVDRRGPFHQSIAHIQDGRTPYQFFLGNPQSARISVKDEDIAATKAHIESTGARIFIHAPYIINLAKPAGEADEYHVNCLKETTRIAAAMGCSGVVVHVGKALDQEPEVAMANFRTNMAAALEAATPACPILLETPAGQGTEMLRSAEDFTYFVTSFNDRRLRACIDTCHVFACGHNPLEYIQQFNTEAPKYLKLIHFNDSDGELGSCVDRHAFMGLGHIGLPTMRAIAEFAAAAGVPALIE